MHRPLGRACEAADDVDCARKAYERLAQMTPGTNEATRESIDHAKSRLKALKGKKGKKGKKGPKGGTAGSKKAKKKR